MDPRVRREFRVEREREPVPLFCGHDRMTHPGRDVLTQVHFADGLAGAPRARDRRCADEHGRDRLLEALHVHVRLETLLLPAEGVPVHGHVHEAEEAGVGPRDEGVAIGGQEDHAGARAEDGQVLIAHAGDEEVVEFEGAEELRDGGGFATGEGDPVHCRQVTGLADGAGPTFEAPGGEGTIEGFHVLGDGALERKDTDVEATHGRPEPPFRVRGFLRFRAEAQPARTRCMARPFRPGRNGPARPVPTPGSTRSSHRATNPIPRHPPHWNGMPVKAILFDLIGTLIDEESDWEALDHLMGLVVRKFELDADPRDFSGDFSLALMEILHQEEDASEPADEFAPFEEAAKGIFGALLEVRGYYASTADVDWFWGAYLDVHRQVWRLYPEVSEVLRKLKADGHFIGIVSDADRRLAAEASLVLKLDACVDAVTTSEEAGFVKPNPAMFLLAAEKAGVDPADCLVVGDSFERDVEGAHAAGMPAVLIDRHRARTVDVKWKLANLKRLPKLVDEISARSIPSGPTGPGP